MILWLYYKQYRI